MRDGRGHHPAQRRQAGAQAVGQRDDARHVHAEGPHQHHVLGGGPQVGAQPRALHQVPDAGTGDQRGHHHPGPVVRQEHEAQARAALQRGRCLVGDAGDAEFLAQQAFDHQRDAEGQQQPVHRVEPVTAPQHEHFHQHAEDGHQQGRDDQRHPVVQPEAVEHVPGQKGAQHVQHAMREVHDVQHAEDHRQAEAQQRVERTVDHAHQQLREQCLRRHAKEGHCRVSFRHRWRRAAARWWPHRPSGCDRSRRRCGHAPPGSAGPTACWQSGSSAPPAGW